MMFEQVIMDQRSSQAHVLNRQITGDDPDWWRGAVIYEIYPRSFQDTNGDGIGDLAGIAARLPYIADLGVDAIWVAPFFTSPMKDFGYDISDYRGVDPLFGSLSDFDRLVSEAHRLGLKVMIDQVLSHTSDKHPWFAESRSSRDNAKADWFVWADAHPDGSPPNNWLSIFGGSAWEWDTARCQYYLHNFLIEQPDLNFHNPEVRLATLANIRFWLERGVDGFRLDTVNFYFHHPELRDNPPADDRSSSIAPAVNPYNYQSHLYDKSQPENLQFLADFRSLLDEFPGAAAVGEVGDAERALQIMADYTSGRRIQMCYTFELLSSIFSPAHIRSSIEAFEQIAADSWGCWAFSNHDVVRHVSRWSGHAADADQFAKLCCALLLSLRGSICLYQGEELGLEEAQIAYEDLQDPYGIRFWPNFVGRDGCRTPMPWQSGTVNAGFSGEPPWLPVSPVHLARAVDLQDSDDSVLAFYRQMLKVRRDSDVLKKGEIEFLDSGDDILAFRRGGGEGAILCVFNLSPAEVSWTAPRGLKLSRVHQISREVGVADQQVKLNPNGFLLAEIE